MEILFVFFLQFVAGIAAFVNLILAGVYGGLSGFMRNLLALAIAFFVLFLVTCWQKEKYSLLKIPLSFIFPAAAVFFFFAGLFCVAFR